MTVDAARRTRRRAPKVSPAPEPMFVPPSTIAIGEIDQTIFECPSCSRPLALGARRCPGCRTRLIAGVTLRKASSFVAAGLAVGLLAGMGGGIVFGFSHAPASAPAAAVGAPGGTTATSNPAGGAATTAPTATATPTSTPSSDPGIPPLARSALTQAVATNDRLATAKAALRAALAASAFDASSVAQVLRGVSADSLYGEQLAGYVATWSGAGDVGATLSTFYSTTHELAANGLVASVRNTSAYRAAATAMIKQLGELPAVDATMRSAAQSAGFELPAALGPTIAP
jgi:hypothetical protein